MMNKKAALIALLVSLFAGELLASNFASGDVLICFRKASPTTGASLGGTNLVVDAGPVSAFTNLPPNSKITIANLTGTVLSQTGTNSVGWSAFAYFDGAPVPGTIFITSPRSSLNVQTSPNNCSTASQNGNTIGQLSSIANGALANSGFSPLNNANEVLELDSFNAGAGAGSVSYYNGVGSSLDFNGTYTYGFENFTPANFTTSGNAVRSDFYWSYPVPLHTTAPAAFLGYFEFGTNGVMTYTAYPSAVLVTPVIISFTRNLTTNSITFSTGATGTYYLRGTNSAGLLSSRSTWPAITSTGGTGGNVTLKDVNVSSNFFYIISAQ
jgi:hypothetical protein